MIATSRPRRLAHSRTSRARSTWSSARPCEKLRRTTSTPASSMRSSTAGSLQAGPRVATILVLRCKGVSCSGIDDGLWHDATCNARCYGISGAGPAAARPRCGRRRRPSVRRSRAAPGSPPRAASCLRGTRGTRRRRWRCSEMRSAMPYLAIAASVSPPPAMENAVESAIASATALVPRAEGLELEHADRPVPDDGAGLRKDVPGGGDRSAARCRGSDRRQHILDRLELGPGRRRELLGHHGVDRESAPCPGTRR